MLSLKGKENLNKINDFKGYS